MRPCAAVLASHTEVSQEAVRSGAAGFDPVWTVRSAPASLPGPISPSEKPDFRVAPLRLRGIFTGTAAPSCKCGLVLANPRPSAGSVRESNYWARTSVSPGCSRSFRKPEGGWWRAKARWGEPRSCQSPLRPCRRRVPRGGESRHGASDPFTRRSIGAAVGWEQDT